MQNLNASESVKQLSQNLFSCGLPVHSFLAEQHGSLLEEAYAPPYSAGDLHRMFSVTKSICSLATGFLLEDGLISLEDRIVTFFPEYRPENGFHPWQEQMTIRHMLTMQTCYSSTTYKADLKSNWVKSFFTTAPSHRSGQIFLYDTSSSHTLAALVKKLTGKGVLDYLREKCLDSIGFSKEAYIIPDPFGSEMGGSGLMAKPSDLLKLGRYCMDTLHSGTGRFADYLREATSWQVPTLHSGQTAEEKLGYGYQFWQVRGGFAMYGMGGQYLLFYPQLDLLLVLTADTQNTKGGYQILLDLVYEALKPLLQQADTDSAAGAISPSCRAHTAAEPVSWDASYRLLDNPNGFTRLRLSFSTADGGQLILEHAQTAFHIPFGFASAAVGKLEKYDQRISVQASVPADHMLYLPVQITDECVGSIHVMLHYSETNVTLWMKKIEETYFHEFQGFLEGERE